MKNYIKLGLFLITTILSASYISSAAEPFFSQVGELIRNINGIIGGDLTTLLMSVAFICFIGAVINFLIKRNNGGNGLEDAKKYLLWSVVGLFVMVAVWGLVNFLEVNLLGNKIREIKKPQTKF